MENNALPDPDLDDVSGFLREQVELCHRLTKSVFNTFCDEPRTAQDKTLKMLTRLIAASATAAGAMNRVKGTQIHQTILIQRMEKQAGEGASPQNAKTNSGVSP